MNLIKQRMKKQILFTLLTGAFAFILRAQSEVNPWQITLGANALEFYERGGLNIRQEMME